jgi:hypothetical protein
MPYSFKTNALRRIPIAGEELTLTSHHNHVGPEFAIGDKVYVFVENNSVLGKIGGLVARGILVSASLSKEGVSLAIRFDGVAVSLGLATRDLDRFAHPQNYSMPELEHPALKEMFPILHDIAEVRRNTTGQPVHKLSDEAASWLDLYHFEKEKR